MKHPTTARKGIKVNVAKLKKIFSNLPEIFIREDVKSELDKYRGLTETPRQTTFQYISEMKKLNWIENLGVTGRYSDNGRMKYKKIKESNK